MPYRTVPKGLHYTAADLAWFRRPLAVFLLGLGACAGIPHVDPAPRDAIVQGQTVVRVESRCGDDTIWSSGHIGTGVVISERHVLTAEHVVACPMIPVVHVTLANGDRHRMYVTREDETHDIAKLELAHAGRFGLDIPPPKLAGPWVPSKVYRDYLCAVLPDEPAQCAARLENDLFEATMEHGDSGAPVYDGPYLVGLVIRDVQLQSATRMTIVDATWLEGT